MLPILVAVALLGAAVGSNHDQTEQRQLANYRLTAAVFQRFQDASRKIAGVVAEDETLRTSPLFSQEVVQSGDVLDVAPSLTKRLKEHTGLAHALVAARITPDDYTRFALALLTARMAYGYVESGALRSVPPGAPTANVAFVRNHLPEIDAVLLQLGVEIK